MQNPGNVMISNSAGPFPGGVIYLQPAPAPAPTRNDSYLHIQSIGLGAAQLTLGLLCIIFNGVSLGLKYYYYDISFVGHGFWCGALFIVTGALGLAAGLTKRKCSIIAYLVLCIISACFTAVLLSLGIIGAVVTGGVNCRNDDNENNENDYNYGYSNSYSYYYRPPCSNLKAIAAMEGCMAVYAMIAGVLFIWGSTLACKAKACNCSCCCCQDTYQQHPMIAYTNCAPNNFQGMQVVSYPIPTMPYQQGMVAMSGLPPYTATPGHSMMVPEGQAGMGEAMFTGEDQKIRQ